MQEKEKKKIFGDSIGSGDRTLIKERSEAFFRYKINLDNIDPIKFISRSACLYK